MDIEKLIERLYTKQQSYAAYTDSELAHVLEDASTALSTLQAENEKLREKIEDARLEGYAKGLGEMSEEIEKLRAELKQKQNQQATITEVINACALNELRAYKKIGNVDYFKRLAEMDKAGKYIQPAHLAAIRDMSRILATIGPALQGAPEEIENVLRLYDSEIKEARED